MEEGRYLNQTIKPAMPREVPVPFRKVTYGTISVRYVNIPYR